MGDILTTYIELINGQVSKGIYVYGGNGENLSGMTDKQRLEYMNRRETLTKDSKTGEVKYTKAQNIARCERLYEKRKKAGVNPILAFDCSGLQYWAGKQVGVFKTDISANGIYGKCKKIEKKDVKRGDFCFMHNGKKATHVGMYIGNDIIVECQGRDVGVVTNKLSRTTVFNKFGRLSAFEPYQPIDPPSPTPPTPEPTGKYVRVKGKCRIVDDVKKYDKSVYVRNGNGTGHPAIGIAHSTEEFKLIKQEETSPYWYKIEFKGSEAWITSLDRYTEVVSK